MTIVAFDTLKTTRKLQDSGFSRKQATGVVEVLADALAEHPRKDVVIEAIQEAVVRVNDRITATERRLGERIDDLKADHGAKLTALATGQAEHGVKLTALEAGQAEHGVKLTALEAGQAELKAGQAVLMENQSELRREVKGNGALLAAIVAHLGIAVPSK